MIHLRLYILKPISKCINTLTMSHILERERTIQPATEHYVNWTAAPTNPDALPPTTSKGLLAATKYNIS
jgi:hypothetical protein